MSHLKTPMSAQRQAEVKALDMIIQDHTDHLAANCCSGEERIMLLSRLVAGVDLPPAMVRNLLVIAIDRLSRWQLDVDRFKADQARECTQPVKHGFTGHAETC